ncbi:MOSC domain-containing protein [Shewanella gelidii]|uniref:Molybdenum cofactor sulfurase n=1 Tax=Shewanella gelidii TaxID=1642821 RepID=A0A917JYB4_9GAMM|nr:MOSC domain-containing protein [Shewanella gelidii]MCL1098901.1 MOSC domain-containing protein [Shewanella gelidii]GGI89803.1 molybdenum cofactor sulfurase [Shewanella gelidii]
MSEATQIVNRISGLFAGSDTKFVDGLESAIDQKQPQPFLVVKQDRVQGDWQADRRHHGGEDRVLHHFPREHYNQYHEWGMLSSMKDSPSMGENISTVGLLENQVNIGDVLQIGEVVVQVTQPRAPCFKLNLQFGHEGFALKMQQSARCGWFYRVFETGTIRRSDRILRRQRTSDISIAEAMAIYFSESFDAAQYQRLLKADGLAESWRQSLACRLEHGTIENWQMRLTGQMAT